MNYRKKDILKFMEENPRAILSDLAKMYGISKQGMYERLKLMGISWKDLRNESRKNQILNILAQNPDATRREIAKKVRGKL